MSRSLKARLLQAARETGFLANDPSPMRDPDDPPIGWTDGDRDGAKFYMGCRPDWTPDREGQRAAVLPPVGDYLHHDSAACPTCGTAYGLDTRRSDAQTCAGCLRAGDRLEYGIMAEKVRDDAKKEARKKRETEAKGPQDFASRRHRKDRAPRS